MKHLLLAGALCLGLAAAGCNTTSGAGGGTPGQALEKADTDASLIYVAIASSVNAYKALPTTTPDQVANAEAIKVKAWDALGVERKAYAAGQGVDLSALNALFAQAHNLGVAQ